MSFTISEKHRQPDERFSLPLFFSDHAVLQAKKPVRFWGKYPVDGGIAVALYQGQALVSTTFGAAKDGKFDLTLPEMPYGGPYTIRVIAENGGCAELQDILLSAILEDVEITDEDTYIEVCFPTADGDTAYENSISYQGVVEKKGTQEGKDGLTKDVAILKLVGAKKLVALPLSESYPESNSQIVSAGYPGAAEEIFNAYGSEDSELSVSINTGKATRVVKINDTKYQAIEISSTISNGSSGGPSVDKNLNIEGLNTYMLAADNRFAYMVPAEFIKDLAGDIDLSLSGTSKTFYTGLQMLQQGYGKSAKECFEFTKQLQSKTPYIKHMLSLAEEAPQKEFVSPSQAQTSLWDKIMENKLPIIIISAIFFVFVLLIVIIVFMAKRMRKRKKIIQELGGFSDTEYNEDDYDNEEVVSNVNSPENNRADYGAGNMGYGAERSGSDNGGGARAEGTSRIITTIDTAKREDTSVENAEGQAFFNVPPEL